MAVKIKLLWSAVPALSFIFLIQDVLAQSPADLERINRNWDRINKNYSNLNKETKVGEFQKAGEIQKSGQIQAAGEIKIPRGLKAISSKKEECSHRFIVGSDTLFEFDKSTLNSFALETLNVLKPMIEKLGPHPVKVEGHTDSKGSDEYNQNLSEKRAQRVKNWLLENHVCPPSAVATEGFGEKRPVANNENADGSDNPQGRALNRRVEIIVDTCKKLEGENSEAGKQESTNSSRQENASVDNSVWLPHINVITADEIKSSFTRLKVTPLKNRELYFEILVPNGWESTPIEVPAEVVKDDLNNQVPLAQIEPDNEAVIVEVRYMRVPEDVSLTRFVKKYAEATGFELVTRQQGEFNQRQVEDVLLRKNTDKNIQELTRLTASRRGALVFFVASSCPAKDYERWKKTFAAAAISFDPSGNSGKN